MMAPVKQSGIAEKVRTPVWGVDFFSENLRSFLPAMQRLQREEAEFAAQLERALQLSIADQVWQVFSSLRPEAFLYV